MDRRTIAALVLSLVLVQTYLYFFGHRPEPVADTAAVGAGAPGSPLPKDPTPGNASGSTPTVETPTPPAPAAVTPAYTKQLLPFEYCGVKSHVSTDGGALTDLVLTDWKADYKATAVWTWVWHRLNGTESGGWKPYDVEGGPARLLTGDSTFLAVSNGSGEPSGIVHFTDVKSAPGSITLSAVTPNGISITRTYTSSPDCKAEVVTSWTNHSGSTFEGKVALEGHDVMDANNAHAVRPVGMAEGSAVRWSSLPEEESVYPGPVQWFGIHDHYFGVFAVGGSLGTESLTFGPRKIGNTVLHGEEWKAPVSLANGQAVVVKQTLYIGAKQIEDLAAVSPDLKNAVDLGYFGFFVRPLLWLLKFLNDYIGNWGLSIVALTFLVKMALYPVQLRAFKSGQAMQDMQPKIKALQEKYVDQPEELARQQTKLMFESGANPVGGCLPVLAQFPVFISLYTMIGSAVEIHQQPFLYLKDLSSIDPIGVFPLLVVGAMVLNQRQMPTANLDPAQQQMMQLMPLIFGVIMFSVPSGLVVYSLSNIVLGMVQQWWMKRVHTRNAEGSP